MWKEIEHRYPIIGQMAKDILSIPASGVGVERLFNTARDVCHYRRNRLNSNTIEIVMLVKYYEQLLTSTEETTPLNIENTLSIDIDEPPMDEQIISIKEDVEWETESDDESIIDTDSE